MPSNEAVMLRFDPMGVGDPLPEPATVPCMAPSNGSGVMGILNLSSVWAKAATAINRNAVKVHVSRINLSKNGKFEIGRIRESQIQNPKYKIGLRSNLRFRI